jgi:hypothetical protein
MSYGSLANELVFYQGSTLAFRSPACSGLPEYKYKLKIIPFYHFFSAAKKIRKTLSNTTGGCKFIR